MDRIKVTFEYGESRKNSDAVNYMLARAEDAEGEEIELYSEITIPDELLDCEDYRDADDYGYEALKEDIKSQAIAAGIDPERLIFWYDD